MGVESDSELTVALHFDYAYVVAVQSIWIRKLSGLNEKKIEFIIYLTLSIIWVDENVID